MVLSRRVSHLGPSIALIRSTASCPTVGSATSAATGFSFGVSTGTRSFSCGREATPTCSSEGPPEALRGTLRTLRAEPPADYEGTGDAPNDYTLLDLIDRGTTLERWIPPGSSKAERVHTYVEDHELCTATPSVELDPYASEYEGYMGNYGNTMDRWYRRAAVVVSPRERAFAVRAEASPGLGRPRAG